MTASPIELPVGDRLRVDLPGAGDPPAARGAVRRRWESDADEFDRFCRNEHRAVVGLAYALTNNWGAAEDLAQDAFFAAFRQWHRLSTYDDPGAWVRRVVSNRAVSRRRRLANEAKALTRLAGHRASAQQPGALDHDVWGVVCQLPRRQAQVFALTYVDDLSLDQVAAVLEISPLTAKTHLQRARAVLAAALAGTSPEGPTR